MQKREAVNMFFDIFPVYTSVLLQAIARVIAFSMLFSSSKGSSGGETVTFLAIHIILVFFIRLHSTKQWVKARKREGYTFGWYDLSIKFLVDIVAAFCSCLVYCNIRHPPPTNDKRDIKRKDFNKGKEDHKYTTTFFSHFSFFVLVLVENSILTAWEGIFNRVTGFNHG